MAPAQTYSGTKSQNQTFERFSNMENSDFPNEMEKIWLALTEVKDTISREVEANHLSPIEALQAIGSLSSSVMLRAPSFEVPCALPDGDGPPSASPIPWSCAIAGAVISTTSKTTNKLTSRGRVMRSDLPSS